MENESGDEPIAWHFLVKDFYDYAENIESVSIHYAYAVHTASPEWAIDGHIQNMPLVLQPGQSLQIPARRAGGGRPSQGWWGRT